jgi:Phage integrase, N-terminal SAM-like domain
MGTSRLRPLTVSWELTLRADGYAANTIKAYQNAVRSLAGWLAEHHPDVGPVELDREHVRGWLVHLRETRSSSTARGWFAGVRHFCRWLQSEGASDRDAGGDLPAAAGCAGHGGRARSTVPAVVPAERPGPGPTTPGGDPWTQTRATRPATSAVAGKSSGHGGQAWPG